MTDSLTSQKKVVFAIGTGRCGTTFLAKAFAQEPNIASWHERHPMNDAFHRYCQWNKLAVDHGGFLATKRLGVEADWQQGKVSFESSAYLSLSILKLHEAFDAHFILLVRRPDQVVNSYLTKGWYQPALVRDDPNLPAGYQPHPSHPHHPFSRITPQGEMGKTWHQWSRVGQIAWYWSALNTAVLELFKQLPSTHVHIQKIEAFNYPAHQALSEQFDLNLTLSQEAFEQLVNKKPNKVKRTHSLLDWSQKACQEFETNVSELAEKLGYIYDTKTLKNKLVAKETRQAASWRESVNNQLHKVRSILKN